MLKSHQKFHSINGKRLVLVVDDEVINRELLGVVLEQEYEVLYASNGEEALQIIQECRDTLSLVLLDLLMPKLSGIEVLKRVRENELTKHIPIIVVTTDQEAEVESLTLGATDFISKPYPQPDVILARLLRTIELSEDREIISSTERDNLTGLYNKEFFFRYAEQFDNFHRDREMDAIVIDVNHFRMLNERYGRELGDEILRRIGQQIRSAIPDEQGLVGRREADAFLVYCFHGLDYEEILEKAAIDIEGDDDSAGTRVRLRMGIYPEVDKTIDIERRFDRAKMAADKIRNNYTQKHAFYDNTLHDKELYAEQLASDFQEAVRSQQFHVFYQPKFNIQGEVPVLSSAEALVRWVHPQLGMISPGVFIPLFEENGMIRQLDHYVWREAASQIRAWRDKYDYSLPVSVNMSRVDMFDEELIGTLEEIIREYDLSPREFLLEITESAYTNDSEMIIEMVHILRNKGFRIEMDDFGTGYSSLGMISNLPIDALKLDMMFVRNAFNERQDVKMLELILDLARHLEVPVIAEGVETREQMRSLKAMGCDLVQGYYFSKPVPPEEFEHFVAERALLEKAKSEKKIRRTLIPDLTEVALRKISSAMTSDFENIYFVDTETGYYMEFGSHILREGLQLQKGGEDFFEDMQRNFTSTLHPEDRDKVMEFLHRDYLTQRLDQEPIISMTYRLLIGGEPMYYRLQAVQAKSGTERKVIIGIRSVNKEARKALSEERIQAENVEIYEMAQAMAHQYETIYYVDWETEAYSIFNAGGRHEELKLSTSGVSFFDDIQFNLQKLVHPADQAVMAAGLTREAIADALDHDGGFTIDYRLMFDGQPVFYRMVGFFPEVGDDHHFMLGICNVDEEKSRKMKPADAEEASAIYTRIAQAISRQYFSIYLVDVKDDSYAEYNARISYSELPIETTGENFFQETRDNILRLVHPEDQKRALAVWEKDQLLRTLDEEEVLSVTYRLMIGGEPAHFSFEVLRLEDEDDHIIVAVRNVEKQMRRERGETTEN